MKAYVQAVPERLPYVIEEIKPAMMWMGGVEVVPVVDKDHKGPLWNARRIWGAVGLGEWPALVLQDDVVVHDDLLTSLPGLLRHIDRMKAISLFVPPDDMEMTKLWLRGFNFFENHNFLSCQGVIYSPEFCRALVMHSAVSKQTKSDDVLINEFCKVSGRPVWNALPSLVQHHPKMASVMEPDHKTNEGRMTKAWQQDIPEGFFEEVRCPATG